MPENSPELRTLYARLGAYEMWAKCKDRTAHTANGRKAFDARFEREVDPDGTLAPPERDRRAKAARKAYYIRLSIKSAQIRQAKAAARRAQQPPRPTPE